jgi:hypothetical protein
VRVTGAAGLVRVTGALVATGAAVTKVGVGAGAAAAAGAGGRCWTWILGTCGGCQERMCLAV